MDFTVKLLVFLFVLDTTYSDGVFELRLLAYHNDHGKDAAGFCCGKFQDSNGHCTKPCATFFRVCLKQYQNSIDPQPPCTYGSKTTEVIGGNSVDFSTKQDFEDPFQFPFSFAWPGSFSLIVEAWHNTTESNDNVKQLLLRLAEQKTVKISQDWTVETHGSNGSRLELQYRVVCSEHHYGAKCMDYCRPRDDNYGHYKCSFDGSKQCLEGWQGRYCDKAICRPGCHPEQGKCDKPGECVCKLGFIGDNCDQCQKYPQCQHGTCSKPFECLCDEGWGGMFCNQDLNYCTHHKPCLHGSTCTNTGAGHYTCTCRPGFTGTNCEIKIEDCSHSPCINGGECKELESNYTCSCLEGFSGRHCQISATTCEERPCENGATCSNLSGGGYICICVSGWEGSNCDIEKDECRPNPCKNGGRCVDGLNTFQCVCSIGFNGKTCQNNINDCSEKACLNGGTCTDEVNAFKCKCPAGWTGSLCQENIDDCAKRPCANGGTCFDLINDFRCMCRPGFSGKTCSIDFNECQSNPCRNGGSCEDLIDDYKCFCPSSCFRGKNCEIRDDCNWETTFQPFPYPNVTVLPPVHEASTKMETTVLIVTVVIFAIIAVGLIMVVLVLYRRMKRNRNPGDPEAQNARNQKIAARAVPTEIRNNLYISAIPNPYGEFQKPKLDNRERYQANLKAKNLSADLNSPNTVNRLRQSLDDPNTCHYPVCKAISVEKLNFRRADRACISPEPRSPSACPQLLKSEISTDSGLGSPGHSMKHHRGSDITLMSSTEDETVLIVERTDSEAGCQSPSRTLSNQQVHRHPPPTPPSRHSNLATQV